MATQLRDTQIGHLIRLLSGKKLLPYPDEVDSSLWKKSALRPSPLESSQGPQIEKPPNTENPANNPIKDLEAETNGSNRVIENGKDIYLVEWYGPDDPEVILSFL